MADSKYKLTYFQTKGLGEGIRYMFAYVGVDFEDVRIKKEDWPAMKDKTPYGSLPILEVDGKVLNQSSAISRYLGKRFGLVADDPFTEALLEALIDNVKDLQTKMRALLTDKSTETEKAAHDATTLLFTKIDEAAKDGYFYGSKPTWVDMYFTGLSDALSDHIPNFIQPYPNLVKLTNNIKNNPNVQKYIKQRPESIHVPLPHK